MSNQKKTKEDKSTTTTENKVKSTKAKTHQATVKQKKTKSYTPKVAGAPKIENEKQAEYYATYCCTRHKAISNSPYKEEEGNKARDEIFTEELHNVVAAFGLSDDKVKKEYCAAKLHGWDAYRDTKPTLDWINDYKPKFMKDFDVWFDPKVKPEFITYAPNSKAKGCKIRTKFEAGYYLTLLCAKEKHWKNAKSDSKGMERKNHEEAERVWNYWKNHGLTEQHYQYFRSVEMDRSDWAKDQYWVKPSEQWMKKNWKPAGIQEYCPSGTIYWALSDDYGDDMDSFDDGSTDNQYTVPSVGSVYGEGHVSGITDNHYYQRNNGYTTDYIQPTSVIYNDPNVAALLFVLGIMLAICGCALLLFCGFGCGWIAKSAMKERSRDYDQIGLYDKDDDVDQV